MLVLGVRGGTVGWATALQAGKKRIWFPMESLAFITYNLQKNRSTEVPKVISWTSNNGHSN